ncbi:response regulator [Campylobacter massiliensis]|nr:response regulator [Campylobacter massiliensis]
MDVLLRNGYDVNLSLLRQGQMQASASRLAGQELVKVGNEAISKDEYISRQYDLLEKANDILMQNSQAYLYKGGSDSVNGYSTGFLGSSAYRASLPMWSNMDNSDRVTQDGYNRFQGSYENSGYCFSIGLPDSGAPVIEEFAGGGYFKGSKSNTILSQDRNNLNDYASENILKTKYGDVEVFLDLYGDNDKLGIGKFSSNAILFNFDSNGDGILNSSDKLFSKLKVRGYDKDGNEKIANLSDVTSGIDLAQFIKKDIDINHRRKQIEDLNAKLKEKGKTQIDISKIDNRIFYYKENPYTVFAPESRYKKAETDSIKNFFDAYADKDGWVDLRNNNVFNKNSLFNNFAYAKAGFDGKLKLNEFNPIISSKKTSDDFSYENYQKDSFMKFYRDYEKESTAHAKDVEWLSKNLKEYNVENADEYISRLNGSKSSYMIAMENEFQKATRLEFSPENLEKVKRAFEDNPSKAALMMNDSDSVIAMKLNDNGSITLKFDSGREIEVTQLYSDTGKLLGDKTRRASLNLETKAMSDIELGSISFNNIGILDTNGKYKTLQEIGASAIKSFSTKHGKQFLIYLGDNKTLTAKDLYNISFLNNELEANTKIDEKDKFYRKVNILA